MNKEIRKMRIRAGLTQSDVARLLRITQVTVCHWERGDSTPRIRHLPKLAAMYGVSVDEIIATTRGEDEK